MAENRIGGGGFDSDPGAGADAGRAVGSVKVNSKASIDPTAFKELNAEFKKLQGFVTTFKQDLPNLIEGTRKWAAALNNVAKSMGKVSESQGGGGGSYIPTPGQTSGGITGSGTTVGSGNTANPTQIANIFTGGGGGGGGTGTGGGKGMAGDIARQIASAIGQAVDNRIARGASYSLSADKMNMLYQQMSGLNQNQTYHTYRAPLQGYRLGMGGINEVLGLQAQTGLDARRQAQSIDAMRASSGYAYSTADLAGMTRQMASPEAVNQMFMMTGTGMYGIGGTQRTQQQVFQDIIRRTGLTSEAAVKGAFQQGSTVRARLQMSGLTEDQINPLLQYAQQNIQFQKKGGQGFYDPSKKSQRELMGVEGNFASQAEETERVKAQREENFYKRQNDNFAQMERNVQAVNRALEMFEEKLSGIVGARVSTKMSMAKGALKWGLAGAAGLVAGVASGGTAAVGATIGTKALLDNVLGDGVTSSPDMSGGAQPTTNTGTATNIDAVNTKPVKVPPNVKKSERYLQTLNPRLASRIRKMLEANPKLYIGGGSRTTAEQKRLFLSRYEETDEQTSVKWQGKYWKKRNPNDADAAPPGVSMHEIGLAADIHGDDNWITAHASEYGLVNFANVNNEPWHVQPKEFTRGQWEYRQAGAPWGLNGAGSQDFDENTELNGQTGSSMSNVAISYGHSAGSAGGGGSSAGGGGGGYRWADMSMSEVINAGRKGDGIYPTTGGRTSARTATKTLSSPLVMSPSIAGQVSGPEYNITIAPNITVTSSGSTTVDAHKLAKEVSALLDREVRLSLMRTT
jgi:hypothetical protein